TSAFDFGNDVLAHSRSTWARSPIDTTWKPTDSWGFKPLWSSGPAAPPAPFTAPIAGPAPAAIAAVSTAAPSAGGAPWSCAERFFRSESGRRAPAMDVRRLTSPQYASLGLTLYEASGTLGGAPRSAVFAVDGNECRLIGGDTDALIGLNL